METKETVRDLMIKGIKIAIGPAKAQRDLLEARLEELNREFHQVNVEYTDIKNMIEDMENLLEDHPTEPEGLVYPVVEEMSF